MRRAATFACRLASHYSASSSCSALNIPTSSASGLIKSLLVGSLASRAWSETISPLTRAFSSGVNIEKELDAINDLFVTARDEIEYAKEEAETVYFNDSVAEARAAVDGCVARWEALLRTLDEEQRGRVVRSMGLKMAQLQAEFDEVSKLHLED